MRTAMIEQMAERVAAWIVRNDPDSTQNYDVFVYVIQCTIGLLFANGILLIIAAFLGLPLQALLWIVFYNALRFFIGGSHANTFFFCILGGTIFAVLCAVATNYLVNYPIILIVEIVFSLIVTFFVAPVVHQNRLMTEEHIQKNHRTAKIIVVVEIAAIILFYFALEPWVSHSAGLGMFSAAVLCVVGKAANKKVKSESSSEGLF